MRSDIAVNYSATVSKTIHLKSVTPITIHGGANEGKTPELRLSTINGMMRYWFEALNNRQVKERSSNLIFGTAESKISQKSIIWLTDNMYRKGGKTGSFRPSHLRKYTISAFEEGTDWPITVSTKKSNKEYLEEGVNALESAVLFGGFGQRGRHGGSSFVLPELEIKNANDLISYLQSLTDFYKVNTEIKQDQLELVNLQNNHTEVRWLSTKIIDTPLANVNTILSKIREATHAASYKELKGVLGCADKNNKFASPLHTSIYQYTNGKFTVIITETSQDTQKTSKYIRAKDIYIGNLQKYLKGG